MVKKISLLLLIALSLSSCVSSKKIHYLQGAKEQAERNANGVNFETQIKPDDLLLIIVSSKDYNSSEAADPFNLHVYSVTNSNIGVMDLASTQSRYQTYLVDRNGFISFPVIGSIKVGGSTKEEVMALLKDKIGKYIEDPILNIRIINYKISVFGEVARPGIVPLQTERITIPEALASAGDLTIYGLRENVVLIREIEGVKTYHTIDLTSEGLVDSPYYYLQQNDVLYVKQNKVKINASAVGPNTTVIISALSLLLTTIALLTR
ncbi:polysaccharide biosynthesis/export family protein [Flavobacterium sp. RHBU_24]|uniref:polysaccharide biosynthesis/export family protein n=1 Tax=Flavobacterium sp. RHBU_24 TaxID=3391185 RepID=UPI003984938F